MYTHDQMQCWLHKVSKDKWDTKKGTGKSMKSHFMSSSASKGRSRDKATSNSKKIKPIALAIIELRLSEGIRQLVSQLL